MKLKVFVSAKQAEVRVEGGKSIARKAKESQEDFQARVAAQVAEDNLIAVSDIAFQVVDAKAVKKFTDEQITAQLIKEAANQKSAKFNLLKEALEERGLAVPEITEEMVKAAKEAAKPKKEPKPKKEKTEGGEMKKRMTLEEAEALKEEWKAKKGEAVEFVPRAGGDKVSGTINGVVVDKRVNMVLVRIKDEAGKLYHKIPAELENPTEKKEPKATEKVESKTAEA